MAKVKEWTNEKKMAITNIVHILFHNIGMHPTNIDEICEHVFLYLEKNAHPLNWNSGDVSDGIRDFIEKQDQENNEVECTGSNLKSNTNDYFKVEATGWSDDIQTEEILISTKDGDVLSIYKTNNGYSIDAKINAEFKTIILK